jgi:hypothetical protein
MNTKAILIGALILALAGLGWMFVGGGSAEEEAAITEVRRDDVSPEEKALVESLLALRAVTLSGTVFADPVFRSLRDFGTEILPEQVGRENPFLPVPAQILPAR